MELKSEKINGAWVYHIDNMQVSSEQWQAKFASVKDKIIRKEQILKDGHAPERVDSYVNVWTIGE